MFGSRLGLLPCLLIALVSPVSCLNATASVEVASCEQGVRFFTGFTCEAAPPVGTGSFSTVYLVKKDETVRVLRVVPISDEEERKNAEHELELFHIFLGHRNIIRFIESQQDDKFLYEILEYGTLGDLHHFVELNPDHFKDHKRLVQFFRRIVKGVQFMHSKGYIHADLKPHNIVVTSAFEPKIIDFNLAVPKGEVSLFRGTLGYVDPSFLISNSPLVQLEFDEYNDVYALGVILYELVHGMGVLPFDGQYEADIIVALSRHRFTIKKGVHIHLARIIHSCLVINKKWRLSVDELLKELDRAERIPENERLTEDLYLYNDEGLPSWMRPIKQKRHTRKDLYNRVLAVVFLLTMTLIIGYTIRISRIRALSDKISAEQTALEAL